MYVVSTGVTMCDVVSTGVTMCDVVSTGVTICDVVSTGVTICDIYIYIYLIKNKEKIVDKIILNNLLVAFRDIILSPS